MTDKKQLSKREAWDLSQLDEVARAVTQDKATEPPFSGQYLDKKDPGMYNCRVCGQALFDASHKYDSGSGWPSFWRPQDAKNVQTNLDESHGMRREEIVCSNCNAHLGHVFTDGPEESGLRYCVNSCALSFEEKES